MKAFLFCFCFFFLFSLFFQLHFQVITAGIFSCLEAKASTITSNIGIAKTRTKRKIPSPPLESKHQTMPINQQKKTSDLYPVSEKKVFFFFFHSCKIYTKSFFFCIPYGHSKLIIHKLYNSSLFQFQQPCSHGFLEPTKETPIFPTYELYKFMVKTKFYKFFFFTLPLVYLFFKIILQQFPQ